ncbi:MAG: hypothetical protein EZS28_037616 [Streblomastix strix]|uniref:Uncharacterized protein n=1 Tax=Streblomastix strix TaxID=222440 RepID=A0A5J4U8I4_9EUKA|nr:MAG: hypothetical protein EZS28_037616 [Streblomastix strix]
MQLAQQLKTLPQTAPRESQTPSDTSKLALKDFFISSIKFVDQLIPPLDALQYLGFDPCGDLKWVQRERIRFLHQSEDGSGISVVQPLNNFSFAIFNVVAFYGLTRSSNLLTLRAETHLSDDIKSFLFIDVIICGRHFISN